MYTSEDHLGIQMVSKKYAAHKLRKLAQHYREALWNITKEGVVRETEYFASKLDPQPEVIQLEKVTVKGMKKMRQELEGTVLPPETSWDEMRRELVYCEGLLRRCLDVLEYAGPQELYEEVEAWLLSR